MWLLCVDNGTYIRSMWLDTPLNLQCLLLNYGMSIVKVKKSLFISNLYIVSSKPNTNKETTKISHQNSSKLMLIVIFLEIR